MAQKRHDDNHFHIDMTEFPTVHEHNHLINKSPRKQLGTHIHEHRHEGRGILVETDRQKSPTQTFIEI